MEKINQSGIKSAIIVCAVLAAFSGCNKSQDTANVSSSNPSSVGTKIDDTTLTSKVKTALLTDPDVKSTDIKVETTQGAVALSGAVDTQAQIDRSVAVAKSVEGVTAVNNMLALKTGTSTVGAKVDDSVVTSKVKTALLNADDLKSMEISVMTNNGDVQLSGFVGTDAQRTRASEIAQKIEGVKNVNNQLNVKK